MSTREDWIREQVVLTLRATVAGVPPLDFVDSLIASYTHLYDSVRENDKLDQAQQAASAAVSVTAAPTP